MKYRHSEWRTHDTYLLHEEASDGESVEMDEKMPRVQRRSKQFLSLSRNEGPGMP